MPKLRSSAGVKALSMLSCSESCVKSNLTGASSEHDGAGKSEWDTPWSSALKLLGVGGRSMPDLSKPMPTELKSSSSKDAKNIGQMEQEKQKATATSASSGISAKEDTPSKGPRGASD